MSWRRVLGEGSVIVASILLAFAVDAWWDGRQEREDEHLLLASLEADLSATGQRLEAVIERHRVFAERAEELSLMSEAQIRALDPTAVEGYLRALGQYMTFEPRGGTLGGLAFGSQLGLISDVRLRGLITEWFQLLEDSEEEAGFLTDIGQQFVISVGRLVDVTQQRTADDLVRITRDSDLMALSRAKLFFGTIYQNDLGRLKEQGDSVLAILRSELR